MDSFYTTLILAGLLAGVVNFFANFINLPFSKPPALDGDPPLLKDVWWIAMIGYAIIGIAGAYLTPLINALVGGLKGLYIILDPQHPENRQLDTSVLFGYGLVFGYSANRLLVGILDAIIKKISTIETKMKQLQPKHLDNRFIAQLRNNGSDIIDECEAQWEAHKSDCSGFVKAVTAAFSVTLTGQADNIVDQIKGAGWTKIADGAEAKQKADNGWLVVAGLKGAENDPPQNNGHVVIVVSGPIAQGKYPSGYWGRLGGVGEKNQTLNWAWNTKSRDRVYYAGRQI